MARQDKFKHKKFFSALWPDLSLHCALHMYTMHQPVLPHQHEYLLNHKEQHSPSTENTETQH